MNVYPAQAAVALGMLFLLWACKSDGKVDSLPDAGGGAAGQDRPAGGAGGEGAAGGKDGAPPKLATGPNVILIVTDDQGCGDFGFMGNNEIQTPNMDRLAREGTLFANFHVTPVCAPSRAGLMTGRHHQRTGVRTNVGGWEIMEGNETTIAERLREAGVRTGAFGKWHLGEHHPSDPNGQGFEEYLGIDGGSSGYFDPVVQHNRSDEPTTGYLTDTLTDAALNFIEAHKQEHFFVYLPYNAPHDPFEAPDDMLALYQTKFPRPLATVYAMVSSVDRNIGRLLEKLHSSNLTDNTVVILTSDNGPTGPDRFNCNLSGRKSSVTQGGVRVPLVFWGSGIPAGKQVNKLAFHVDLFPTLLHFASLAVPSETEIDGMSLKPLIDEASPAWPDRKMFMNFSRLTERELNPTPQPGGAAYFGHYKMVEGDQLYDLETDPGELKNLAADQPALLAEMNAAYLAWFQKVIQERQPLVPIEVGHDVENPVRISTHNAHVSGGLVYGYGANLKRDRPIHGDWVTEWKRPEGKLSLRLRVAQAGDYRISLRLRCALDKAGTPFVVSVGATSTNGTISGCAGERDWVEGAAVTMQLNVAERVELTLQAPDHAANASNLADISHVIVQRL